LKNQKSAIRKEIIWKNEDSHHTVGYLTWRGEATYNSSITLELKNINGISSRIFNWEKDELLTMTEIEK
jgi:hypothetical protein